MIRYKRPLKMFQVHLPTPSSGLGQEPWVVRASDQDLVPGSNPAFPFSFSPIAKVESQADIEIGMKNTLALFLSI